MAELALRTNEFLNKKTKYIAWRPIGSVIVSIDSHTMRLKWLEIVCDLVSPKKRDDFKGIPGWQYLCDHWTKELRSEWIALGKPTTDYPLGRLLQDPLAAQKMWDESVDSQLSSIIGKEPGGVEWLTNTWLWSQKERKELFIIVNADETDNLQVRNWGTRSESYKDGTLVIHPKTKVDWETKLDISSKTKTEITNPAKIINPSFDIPVVKTLVETPNLLDLKVPK